MTLTDMDIIRATLANADISDMCVTDVYLAAEHAETIMGFHNALNELAQTFPYDPETSGVLVKFIEET